MPYISQKDREEFVNFPDDRAIHTPGELNYHLTLITNKYMKHKGSSYTTYNDIIGALECCKLEIYRRIIAPYEDIKLKQNGDVY